jgi:hypothetical protein
MAREVRLGDLSEREKDSTILVLAGYSRRLRTVLEDEAKRNGRVRRELDKLTDEYAPRLAFLERTYIRATVPRDETARTAARMEAYWAEVRHA